MPLFFMAVTITTIHPPATKTALAWDWQGMQASNPMAQQPVVTLAAGLKTASVGAAGTYTEPAAYTVTGVRGLVAYGGAAANGDLTKSAPTPPKP